MYLEGSVTGRVGSVTGLVRLVTGLAGSLTGQQVAPTMLKRTKVEAKKTMKMRDENEDESDDNGQEEEKIKISAASEEISQLSVESFIAVMKHK